MYQIIKRLDGSFWCRCRLQDCTESWLCSDLPLAIKRVKGFAKAMNNQRIKKDDIEFLQQVPVQTIQCLPWDPVTELK